MKAFIFIDADMTSYSGSNVMERFEEASKIEGAYFEHLRDEKALKFNGNCG